MTNNGSGAFGSNATLNIGLFPYCVAAADINHDGKVDLVTANWMSGGLTVLTQVIVGPPTLNLESDGSVDFTVSWSSFSTGFALQTNADLRTTNWMSAGYPVSISNGTNQGITMTSPPTGNLFFRLKQ